MLAALKKAIDERRLATVSGDANGTAYRLRLRLEEPEQEGEAICLRASLKEGDAKVLDYLVGSRSPFKVVVDMDEDEGTQTSFQTAAIKKRGGLFGTSVMLKFPSKITVVERRRHKREPVPEHLQIPAKVAGAGGEKHPRATLSTAGAGNEITSKVWDLSAGGACLVCPGTQSSLGIQPGQALRIIFHLDGQDMEVNAVHRYTRAHSSGAVRIGVQFGEDDATRKAAEDFGRRVQDWETARIRRNVHSVMTRY